MPVDFVFRQVSEPETGFCFSRISWTSIYEHGVAALLPQCVIASCSTFYFALFFFLFVATGCVMFDNGSLLHTMSVVMSYVPSRHTEFVYLILLALQVIFTSTNWEFRDVLPLVYRLPHSQSQQSHLAIQVFTIADTMASSDRSRSPLPQHNRQ